MTRTEEFHEHHAYRNRQLRPDRGPRRRLLGRADRAIDREFPVRAARADAARDRPRARLHQAGGGAGECPDRRARPADCRGDPAGGRRSRARRSRQPVPAGHLADRLGHAVEHERQRGDRGPGEREARGHARRQGAGPPQRPCEQGPVVERQLPDGAARVRGARGQCPAAAGAEDDARPARRPGGALGRHRQDRPHPLAGRDSADARPGILRLRAADRRQYRARRGRDAARSIAWRRAAPRSAPGSTRRRASPTPSPRRSRT